MTVSSAMQVARPYRDAGRTHTRRPAPTRPRLIATVDAQPLLTEHDGFRRPLVPSYVEELELGRSIKALLKGRHSLSVRLEVRMDAEDRPLHIYDVYAVDDGK